MDVPIDLKVLNPVLYDSKHVLTEDTVKRELKSGKLHSVRFLTKTGAGLPRWAEKFVPHQLVGIIEESVIDPTKQTLTTYTRNIGYNTMVVSLIAILICVGPSSKCS